MPSLSNSSSLRRIDAGRSSTAEPVQAEIKAMQYLGFANIVTATWSPEEIEY